MFEKNGYFIALYVTWNMDENNVVVTALLMLWKWNLIGTYRKYISYIFPLYDKHSRYVRRNKYECFTIIYSSIASLVKEISLSFVNFYKNKLQLLVNKVFVKYLCPISQ